MAAALILPLFDSSESPDILEWKADVARRLRDDVGGDYRGLWSETVALASLGDAAIASWAIAEMRDAKGECCWGLSHHIVARSPLPQAHQFVEELLQEHRYDDLSGVVHAYRESPRLPPWPLLKEMALLQGKPGALTNELRELFEPLARDGETRAREFLDLLVQTDGPFAYSDLTDMTREPRLQNRRTLLVFILGLVLAIEGCLIVSIHRRRVGRCSPDGGRRTGLERHEGPGR